LADILERIERISEATEGGSAEFRTSRVVQDAVVRNLEVIGEAARELSAELRRQHPEVSWRAIIGFRTLATHAYWTIDPEKIWPIVESLPAFRKKIATIQPSD
jgi:uncharacterized protein with HEPN domain